MQPYDWAEITRQQPRGAIHFTTSDNAHLWGRFADGAVNRSLHESSRVIAALDGGIRTKAAPR